jgi:uncharacterized membrane protein YphA (DoxX/SURF4 family)
MAAYLVVPVDAVVIAAHFGGDDLGWASIRSHTRPTNEVRKRALGFLCTVRFLLTAVAHERKIPLNILLWVLQVLLAVAFFAHGCLFLAPPASLVEQMKEIPSALRIFIGVAEVLGAIGLTLPGATRVMPWLVSWAAAGLMIVMVCATVFHISRSEVGSAITTTILLALFAFVAYMRWKVMPILPRA